MKLWHYIDAKKLDLYIKEGLVHEQFHREFDDLVLYSYARKALYENVWDDVTSKCRGLIVNYKTFDLVARPFEKFHNIMTADRPETHLENLPDGIPYAYEKLDGSLGVLYHHRGQVAIASKGSFHSDHAQWATEYYRQHAIGRVMVWPAGFTPVFEMICESVQHHVVHYGWEGLVLLALIQIETGTELGYNALQWFADYNGFQTPVMWRLDAHAAVQQNRSNEEGYVLVWPEQTPPFRVKVKFADFLRLQKIVHNATPKRIFEALASSSAGDKATLDIWVNTVTPELSEFIKGWRSKLLEEYARIFKHAAGVVETGLSNCTTRKEFAEWFLREANKPYSAVCFAMLDEKDYGRAIWKLVEPMTKGAKPFITETEEELVA